MVQASSLRTYFVQLMHVDRPTQDQLSQTCEGSSTCKRQGLHLLMFKGCLLGLLPFITSSLEGLSRVQQGLVDIVQALSCLQKMKTQGSAVLLSESAQIRRRRGSQVKVTQKQVHPNMQGHDEVKGSRRGHAGSRSGRAWVMWGHAWVMRESCGVTQGSRDPAAIESDAERGLIRML